MEGGPEPRGCGRGQEQLCGATKTFGHFLSHELLHGRLAVGGFPGGHTHAPETSETVVSGEYCVSGEWWVVGGEWWVLGGGW